MLQQDAPDDYVLATGEQHSAREFLEIVFGRLGFDLVWRGSGVDEIGFDRKTGKTLVEIDPIFFRPTEVNYLCGDATKAREKLGWTPRYTFETLIDDMLERDVELAEREKTAR